MIRTKLIEYAREHADDPYYAAMHSLTHSHQGTDSQKPGGLPSPKRDLPDKTNDRDGYLAKILDDIDSVVNKFDKITINYEGVLRAPAETHVVPVIPIEVKRYVKMFNPKPVNVEKVSLVNVDSQLNFMLFFVWPHDVK